MFFLCWSLMAQIGLAQKTRVFVGINEEDAHLDDKINEFHVRISMQDSVLYEKDFMNGLSRLRLDSVPVGELVVEVKLTTDNQVHFTRRFSSLDEDINECTLSI